MESTGKIVRLLLSALCVAGMVSLACGCGKSGPAESVELTVWGSEESQEMLRQMADAFIEEHKDEADIHINTGIAEESSLAENVVTSTARAADVFSFPDDQFVRLMDAKALLPVTLNTDEVISENGGKDTAAVSCAMSDGQLYAYPMTASNGYFMYYNAEYFEEEDVSSLDRILDIAEENGKYFAMDWSSGWYIYSFFSGAGLELTVNDDETANICDWNKTDTEYKGTDVANAMLDISGRAGFYNCGDDDFKEGVKSGTVIAGVNGQWNASFISEEWGENYRAVKLPTYTIRNSQVQMRSFSGYKLVGVNATSKYPEWAMKFAQWITGYDNQLLRFGITGECPSNVRAAESDEVQASQAVKALSEQAPYSSMQRVTENFWTPATVFGTVMAYGNPDNSDLQELLDTLVSEAEKPVSAESDVE